MHFLTFILWKNKSFLANIKLFFFYSGSRFYFLFLDKISIKFIRTNNTKERKQNKQERGDTKSAIINCINSSVFNWDPQNKQCFLCNNIFLIYPQTFSSRLLTFRMIKEDTKKTRKKQREKNPLFPLWSSI